MTDFEEILHYSWTNFPGTSERFANAILNHVELLRTFPYVGSLVEARPGVRQLIHTPILIYYRVHDNLNLVEILHFQHGSRRDLNG